MTRYIVVHYAEIGLKGKNRGLFERQLQRNIQDRLQDLNESGVTRRSGRLMVHLEDEKAVEKALDRLRTVPGVAYFAPAYGTSKELETLKKAVLEKLQGRSAGSFKVKTRRADKSFPLTSPEINAEVGGHVQAATGWPVDLSNPELTIHVELMFKEILFYLERIDGVGGLPVGSSGKVGLLLSGGIDSPVAGYYALKRGCSVVPIHFHSGPFGDWQGAEDKIRRLVTALRPYGMSRRYYVVPIGEIQRDIVAKAPGPPRVLLYRRLMVRLAQELTRREKGLALITGESLGQVASQTLESMAAVEAVASMPMLRPLVGLDKQEIVNQAEVIDTFDISIESGDDCCQFLMPRRVVTRPSLAEIESAEANLNVAQMVADGLAAARLEHVT